MSDHLGHPADHGNPGATDRSELLRLLHEHFLNRTDRVAILAPWGKPCPVEVVGSLDDLLLGHLLGDNGPMAQTKYDNGRGPQTMTGRFRVGSYAPSLDDRTRWVCLDFDGPGHSSALADPLATATEAFDGFERAGFPVYLERSGGGQGWHLWCFFEQPIPAGKAQELGRALAPKSALLADGQTADANASRGIEVFPKQKSRNGGFGNLVWLPWWNGASAGANVFYRRVEAGSVVSFTPTDFDTTSERDVDDFFAVTAPAPTISLKKIPPANPEPKGLSGEPDPAWADWRRRALEALPLEAVYGGLLTGKKSGAGWLECRDPSSASGDQNPSAGVADGTGDAERGSFHSFISGETVSVFDFMMRHHGVHDFSAAKDRVAQLSGVKAPNVAPEGYQTTPEVRPEKPQIVISTEEHAVADSAIAALARVPGVFCRGQLLVHAVREPGKLAGITHPVSAARIVALGQAGVRDRLTLAADCVVLRERKGETTVVPRHPPAWLAPAIEARKSWPGMRHLEGIVESPVLRPDGSVLDQPGYDETTGLLYEPSGEYPAIARNPTKEDAIAAAIKLIDVVCDFPFKTDAHRSAWLASLLTPLARYAFSGPSPLFLMDANVRSSGKTLLADVVGEIVAGRPMSRTPQATDEGEEMKRITAILLEGTRLVLIDNINRPLGSGAMDAVLTGTTWSDRILGKSQSACLPLMAVWYASGNNITFKCDTARRCLPIRIESELEKPEDRAVFKRPQLLSWVQENRGGLVAAAVTILRAFCAAGKPRSGVKPWGSFEGWSAMVREALVWCELPDPAEARGELDEVDTDKQMLADIIAGWEELSIDRGATGFTAGQVLNHLREDADGRRYSRLRSALAELPSHGQGELPSASRLGCVLRRFRGRVFDGRRLQTRVVDGNNLWFVQHLAGPRRGPETEGRDPG
jgi:hypothetical protein